MPEVHLLSTDFDGTLIGFSSDGRCPGAFAQALNEHRRGRGLWAVNTGRDLHHALDGLERFGGPTAPDFLLTNERHVFRRTASGQWEAHGEWNALCNQRHEELFASCTEFFRELKWLASHRGDFELFQEGGSPVGLVARSESVMESIIVEMSAFASLHPEFSYQRNTVYLRFCHLDYHKGSALAELARIEGLDATKIFAVGDHFNDIPMLRGDVAAHVACPANAIPEVQEVVREAGGFVASLPHGEGVAEALARLADGDPTALLGRPTSG